MRRLTPLFVGCLLVIAACGGSDGAATSDTETTTAASATTEATATTEAEPVGTDPEFAEPEVSESTVPEAPETSTAPEVAASFEAIEPGEYAVGVTTITITDTTRGRPLTVDVWFPLAADTTGDPHRYTFVTGDYFESPAAITAEPTSISPDGPFPLVVYSHGSGGQRYIDSNYTEALASHGYLVVAPDHTGNTAIERVLGNPDPTELIAINRPKDVEAVINAMLDPENPETVGFVASADPERIAVTGHSFGGFTTLAVAAGYSNELGDVAADSRIDAIIPLAPAVGSTDPANQLLSDAQLSAITTPTLVIVGTNDQTTPVDPNITRLEEFVKSETLDVLQLVDGQHNTFTDLCAYLDFFPTLPAVNELVLEAIQSQAAEGCSPGDMPIDRAQELTNTFAIRFLDSIFADRERLTADTITMPDDVIFTSR